MTKPTTGSPCRRCGICCRKGGPGLHHADRFLVEEGRIPLERLFTIRAGETVYDNVQDRHHRTDRDIIKIKDKPEGGGCTFLNGKGNGCDHYEDRPLECRLLNCRDTRKIEAVYSRRRLVRRDLLGNIQGLWELVADHQDRCDPRKVLRLLRVGDPQGPSFSGPLDSGNRTSRTVAELNAVLQYDLNLREVLAEKGIIHREGIDFLLGRPLWRVLRPFGIHIQRKGERLIWLKSDPKAEKTTC